MEYYRKFPIGEVQMGLPVKADHFQRIVENLDAAVDSQHPQNRVVLKDVGEHTLYWKDNAIAAFVSLTGGGQAGGAALEGEGFGGRAGDTVESILFKEGDYVLKVTVGRGGEGIRSYGEPTSLSINGQQKAVAYGENNATRDHASYSDGVNLRVYHPPTLTRRYGDLPDGTGESSFISAPDPDTGMGRFGSGGSVIVKNGSPINCKGGDGFAFIEWIFGVEKGFYTPIMEAELKAGAPLSSELMTNLVINSDSVCGSKAHIYEYKQAGVYNFDIPRTATYLRFTVTDTGGSGTIYRNGDSGKTTIYVYRVLDLPESTRLTIPSPVKEDTNSREVFLGLDNIEPISTQKVINPNHTPASAAIITLKRIPSAIGFSNGSGGVQNSGVSPLPLTVGTAGCITIEVII